MADLARFSALFIILCSSPPGILREPPFFARERETFGYLFCICMYSGGSGLSIDIHFVDIELSYDVFSPLPIVLSKHFNTLIPT